MIIPKQEVLELIGESDSFDLDLFHRSAEQEIKNYCGWELESATYTNQLVDGTGSDWLWPGPKNITALIRAATDKIAAINFKHSTAASNAYGTVTYTNRVAVSLGLEVADGTAISSTTELFSTYSTMTLLTAQINARSGSGWSAELNDSDYGIFASTNLLESDNINAGTWDGTDPGWSELQMPGKPVSGITIERIGGGLQRSAGWPSGTRNITLTYTAGWTTANMPPDLKQAVIQLMQFFYTRHQQQTTGIKSFSLGHLRIEYALANDQESTSSIPIEALDVLDQRYRIVTIV